MRRSLPAGLFQLAVLGATAIVIPLCASAARAAANCSPAVDTGVRRSVLGELARRLESDYVIPDTASKLAAWVRASERSGTYRRISCAPELARALTRDLFAVAHDKHLHVDYSFDAAPPGPPGPPSPEEIRQLRKLNGLIQRVEILDGNVGYMRVDGCRGSRRLTMLSLRHSPSFMTPTR